MKEKYSKPRTRPYNYFTAGQEGAERQEACEEFKAAILDALLPKLEWVCRMLACFLSGFQASMEDARNFKGFNGMLSDAGVEVRKPTFNDYLRELHGIGRREEKGETK